MNTLHSKIEKKEIKASNKCQDILPNLLSIVKNTTVCIQTAVKGSHLKCYPCIKIKKNVCTTISKLDQCS